jgi:large subunit ribosomal protein L24
MLKIKKNDTIQVIKGKDKGKKGRVLEVLHKDSKALVEGVNMFKKHKRRTQQDQKGGIISIEKPLPLANVMLVCKGCSRPVRVGFSVLKDGTKARICKACKEVI